ncbi:MAG: bifunctional 5,10-methylenetetrahydrofolate dehydrogenase/5,10-methenyltetrahydrofolate cyclohydrolase [Candidatus Stahlbacteria bacterium]|nr:bifunctional 5,10-methylenetetrahydrofolate dehydrogenase/5,10-methenyltetrahydrofolate cyclohydrolase [Candidatus Stahlbacteria bacterium]
MIIDGKAIALQIEAEIKDKICKIKPYLAAVTVGTNDATQSYIRNIQKIGSELGVAVEIANLQSNSSTQEVIDLTLHLNSKADGIIIGRPLPSHIDEQAVIAAILPEKDIDCLHPINLGRLILGTPLFTPCTPQAVMEILTRSNTKISGKRVTIVGRSNIVGKPLAIMLIQKGVDATVTICHTKTKELLLHTKSADILIAAVGFPGLIRASMVKPGAVVIDVGINVVEGKLVGDVEFKEVEKMASLITPVPGGVGPITTRLLFRNVLLAKSK